MFILISEPVQDEKPSGNPCVPSPCGPYSKCQEINRNPACSCLPDYIGRPPNCRPECTTNTDCPGNLACQNEKCKDPCPGSCGLQATCIVVAHSPHCSCMPGYTGDPFSGCSPAIQSISLCHKFSSVLILLILSKSYQNISCFLSKTFITINFLCVECIVCESLHLFCF